MDAEQRARVERLVAGEAPYTLGPYRWDLRDLLAAYDAAVAERDRLRDALTSQKAHCQRIAEAFEGAEAERDQARATLEEHRIAYTAVTGERDAAVADLKRIADRLWREDEAYAAKVAAVEARATRLAALEEAARAWAPLRKALWRQQALTMQRPEAAAEQEAAMDVANAVAALAAPAGETRSADAP